MSEISFGFIAFDVFDTIIDEDAWKFPVDDRVLDTDFSDRVGALRKSLTQIDVHVEPNERMTLKFDDFPQDLSPAIWAKELRFVSIRNAARRE